jgi:long-chain acyl-CoA synthetase
MTAAKPWTDFYPESVSGYTDASITPRHLAEVAGIASAEYGGRRAVSTQLPNGDCATLNFEELDRLSDDFAVYLREITSLQAGDVVAVMSVNCIDFLIAVFGVFKAGCICTNINPLYTAPEMEHQLKDSGAKVLVVVDLFGDKVDAVVSNTRVRHVVSVSLFDFFPPLKKALMGFVASRIRKMVPLMHSRHRTMTAAIRQAAARRRTSPVDVAAYRAGQSIDDTTLYQYTGGTTGQSKGAELTHRNILSNAGKMTAMLDDEMDGSEGDTTVIALPLYHITAFAVIMLPSIQNGTHCVMVPSPRPVSNLKPAFENHEVTFFTGINTLFAALLEEPWCTRQMFRHLKFCGSGGAAQHVAVAERWESLTGVPINQGYGLTECAGVLTVCPLGHNRPGTVGIPLPGMDVKIVDPHGRELQRGEAGELLARGSIVMKGYLALEEQSRETIRDGWLHTGDIAVMDKDGFIRIVDRIKDMILVSGFNVYPNEVEDVISELENVIEVGVIGIPHEKTGEAVKAFVVRSDPEMTKETVMAHCAGSLTNYKRPREVEFVEDIPKTPVGKVLRRNLREMNTSDSGRVKGRG